LGERRSPKKITFVGKIRREEGRRRRRSVESNEQIRRDIETKKKPKEREE
jgi:hypothetical protein